MKASAAMRDLAEVLQSLAACERRLEELNAEVEQLPTTIEDVERRATEARGVIDSEHAELAELERVRREKEARLQDCEEQRNRYRTQSAQVKTNEEYHALLREIDSVTEQISDLEEDILLAMEEIDQRRGRMGRVEADQEAIERDLTTRADTLRSALEEARAQVAQQERERDDFVRKLEPELQKHYRKVQETLGSGTARLSGRTCAACFRDVPYETVNRIVAGEVHVCATCTRVLVVEVG